MAKLTLLIAGLIIAASVLFYLLFSVAEGQPESWTPLIPSIFGALLGVCGLIGLDPAKRKHAMHAGMAIALLSLLALVGEALGRPGALDAPFNAQLLKIVVGVLLIVYLALGIRSFIAARRDRAAA